MKLNVVQITDMGVDGSKIIPVYFDVDVTDLELYQYCKAKYGGFHYGMQQSFKKDIIDIIVIDSEITIDSVIADAKELEKAKGRVKYFKARIDSR